RSSSSNPEPIEQRRAGIQCGGAPEFMLCRADRATLRVQTRGDQPRSPVVPIAVDGIADPRARLSQVARLLGDEAELLVRRRRPRLDVPGRSRFARSGAEVP